MPADDEAVALALTVCRAADDKQATDLRIIEVADLLTLVDLFVLLTARTDRQLKSVAEAIEEAAKVEHGRRPVRTEGTYASGWYLIDFGDVVCHLFDEEQRAYYSLERLWSDVPHRDTSSGEVLALTPPARRAVSEASG